MTDRTSPATSETALFKAAVKARLALAHAAEYSSLYDDAYDELCAAIDAERAVAPLSAAEQPQPAEPCNAASPAAPAFQDGATASGVSYLNDLQAIDKAMQHMGDVLNGMDAVEKEDEDATAEGFAAIARLLAAAPVPARATKAATPAPEQRCFACDKVLKGKYFKADTRDGQSVFVGPECQKKIIKNGDDGYQPPKGGPKLYPMPPVESERAAIDSTSAIIILANKCGIDTDTDGDIWGSTNGALLKFADTLVKSERARARGALTDERIEELFMPLMPQLPSKPALRQFAQLIEREVRAESRASSSDTPAAAEGASE